MPMPMLLLPLLCFALCYDFVLLLSVWHLFVCVCVGGGKVGDAIHFRVAKGIVLPVTIWSKLRFSYNSWQHTHSEGKTNEHAYTCTQCEPVYMYIQAGYLWTAAHAREQHRGAGHLDYVVTSFHAIWQRRKSLPSSMSLSQSTLNCRPPSGNPMPYSSPFPLHHALATLTPSQRVADVAIVALSLSLSPLNLTFFRVW